MLLTKLTVQNLRCYEAVAEIPFHRLTVFIGENDAGKTVLLDGLEFLLTNNNPSASDYRKIGDGPAAEEIIISGVFEIEPSDAIPDRFHPIGRQEFILTKSFTQKSTKCHVLGRGFENPVLNDFGNQIAEAQKDLLRQLGIDIPASNKQGRIEQFDQLVAAGGIPFITAQIEVPFNQIDQYLPHFQRISSADYKQPDSLIQSTLQEAINAFIWPQNETGEPTLLPELADLHNRIAEALNTKVAEMEEILRQINPKLRSLSVQTSVDFSRSLISKNLMLDLGAGPQLIASFGEGTKKKLWMGLLDWIGKTQTQLATTPYFRVYDEPDVNLDYSAERKLFASIFDTTTKENSRTQSVVCTHAVTFVDRASAHSINLIRVNTDGARRVEYLCDAQDENVKTFLATMGRVVGITNSALFYERAFIVVEGESEENALPILYHNLYGRSMIEDGIVLVNLRTCGAWRSVLKILQTNKADVTTMLLDQDCTVCQSSGFVTCESLVEIGFPPEWQTDHCIYIGQKEFEDAFLTSDIVTVLNGFWPKADGTVWTQHEIDALRAPGGKFANDLLAYAQTNCRPQVRNTMRKPVLAEKLAHHCGNPEQIPQPIRTLFERAKGIAG